MTDLANQRPTPVRPHLPRVNAPGEWIEDAACARVGGDSWYPEKGESDVAEDAKRVCRRCPVLAECLDYAIANGEKHGIWGGTNERQRRRLARNARTQVAA